MELSVWVMGRFRIWVFLQSEALLFLLIPGFREREQGHYYCHVYREFGRRVAAGNIHLYANNVHPCPLVELMT